MSIQIIKTENTKIGCFGHFLSKLRYVACGDKMVFQAAFVFNNIHGSFMEKKILPELPITWSET